MSVLNRFKEVRAVPKVERLLSVAFKPLTPLRCRLVSRSSATPPTALSNRRPVARNPEGEVE